MSVLIFLPIEIVFVPFFDVPVVGINLAGVQKLILVEGIFRVILWIPLLVVAPRRDYCSIVMVSVFGLFGIAIITLLMGLFVFIIVVVVVFLSLVHIIFLLIVVMSVTGVVITVSVVYFRVFWALHVLLTALTNNLRLLWSIVLSRVVRPISIKLTFPHIAQS